MKKLVWDIILLVCTKNHNNMILGSWDTKWNRHIFLSFWATFYPFPLPLMILIIKILKKWKKNAWRYQSFPYGNHCECYKKFASRSRPMLFTLTGFFLLHTLFSFVVKQKIVAIAIFLSKLDHRPLFSYLYYKTILVWGLFSIWITNAS